MRHPLTAAIPAILLVLTACGNDTLMGPSGDSPLANGPSTSLPTGTGNGGGASASGSATNPNGDPTLNAKDESGTSVNGGVSGGSSVGGSSSSGGSSSTGGAGGSSSTGGAGNGGGVSSAVDVGGSFDVLVPGVEVIVGYRTTPFPEQAGGICGNGSNGHPEGTWAKTTNGTTSVHPLHVHCTIKETTAPTTITVTVADRATYVQSPNGNLLLNLSATCPAGVTEASCPDRTVHYAKNHDLTTGAGFLTGLGSDGSVWTIDLAQIQHSGSSRPATVDGIATRTYTALAATSNTGLTTNAASFTW